LGLSKSVLFAKFTPEEFDFVKELLDRIDIALERLETLKEGL
jgi:hypothetical protein